jgi:hypothetical protein
VVSTGMHNDRSLIFDSCVSVAVSMIISMFLVESTHITCSCVLHMLCVMAWYSVGDKSVNDCTSGP